MTSLNKLEEAALFVLGVYLFSLLPYEWWWFIALLLLPDLSMAGYLFGNTTGAATYNLVHHKAVAIAIYLIGILSQIAIMELAGVILFSHSSMDRMFGYGLKYTKGFAYTHLGTIGKQAQDGH
jgi:energy-coupling factor transporter transmembrane protein EcfT